LIEADDLENKQKKKKIKEKQINVTETNLHNKENQFTWVVDGMEQS